MEPRTQSGISEGAGSVRKRDKIKVAARTFVADAKDGARTIGAGAKDVVGVVRGRKPEGKENWRRRDLAKGLVQAIFDRSSGSAGADLTSIDMEDLEPASKDGKLFPEWKKLRPKGSPLTGNLVLGIPRDAVLGEGSYGLVWLGVHSKTKQKYAVKNIKLERGKSGKSESGEMALRECEVSQMMLENPHPCIVRLLDVHHFEDNDMYSLVMEFCPGGDLLDEISDIRNLAWAEKDGPGGGYDRPPRWQKYMAQIFLGLEHMHLNVNVLLRDLKPENVVIAEDGMAKLTDFGFGRQGVESVGVWTFGIPTGSPGYCSPEILLQQNYDDRADLYSFGVLCWVLFTGGVTNVRDPQPPISSMDGDDEDPNFEALANDWSKLLLCINDPDNHHALPLSEDERNFISGLIFENPEDRMRHEAVRAHALMAPLALPPAEASLAEVAAWARA